MARNRVVVGGLSRRMLFAIVMFACVECCVQAEGQPHSNVVAEFPMDVYLGAPELPVTFRGVEYRFLVDTGSTATSFDTELRPLLTPTAREAVAFDEYAGVRLTVYSAPEGRIGPVALPRMDAVACFAHRPKRRAQTKQIHGVLGMDALRHFIIRIDFDAGTISFLRSAPANSGSRIGLDLANGRPVAKALLGGVERTFVLDTGSSCYGSGRIAKREFDELVSQGKLSVVDEIPVGTDFGVGMHRAGVASVSMSIGGHHHVGLVFRDFERKYARQMNTLGIGFLRRYVVTFDFPALAAYLAPGSQFRRIDASHDPGGMLLRRDGERISVSHVTGPAFKAGVRPSDVLETLGGVEAQKLNVVQLPRLLSSGKGPTSFVLRRPGDGRTVHFVHDESEVRRRELEHFSATQTTASGIHDRERNNLFRRFNYGGKRRGNERPQ